MIQHQSGAATGPRTKKKLRRTPLFKVLEDVGVDAEAPRQRSDFLDGLVVPGHGAHQLIDSVFGKVSHQDSDPARGNPDGQKHFSKVRSPLQSSISSGNELKASDNREC